MLPHSSGPRTWSARSFHFTICCNWWAFGSFVLTSLLCLEIFFFLPSQSFFPLPHSKFCHDILLLFFFLQIRKRNVLMPSREDDIQCLLYFEIGHNVACFHSQRSLTTLFVNGWLKNFPFLDLFIGFKEIYAIWLRHDKHYHGSSRSRCTSDYMCSSFNYFSSVPLCRT